MDFQQLLLEYKFKTTEKKKGQFWWKEQAWNKTDHKVKVRKEKVERSFQKSDYVLSISGGFESCFSWLTGNNVLNGLPVCEVCCAEMELGGSGQRCSMDPRSYRCRTCLTKESIRHRSFVKDAHCTLMEFVRISFYYFLKGYDPDLAHREMTENAHDGVGAGIAKSSIYSVYALCRERISRHAMFSVNHKKFGGPKKEVLVDFLKLHLRNKQGRSEEWLVLGFIERISGRCRGYMIPNIKQQTIVQYLAKTVAKESVLYTPFYSETGWEFLDKFFDHRRLRKTKSNDYFTETQHWLKESGFDKMWRNVKELEMSYLKFQTNMRRYGKVHENLQMYIDEQVFRTENNTLEEKREALCQAFHVDHWKEQEENKDNELGIGGGYGQFGILKEEEFLRLLKTSGKRVQKFHDHPDEYKNQFYKIKYPKKDDGTRLVVSNQEGVEEDGGVEGVDIDMPFKKLAGEPEPELDIYDIAKKRFAIDKEQVVTKIQQELMELQDKEIHPEDLF
eukprot:403355705